MTLCGSKKAATLHVSFSCVGRIEKHDMIAMTTESLQEEEEGKTTQKGNTVTHYIKHHSGIFSSGPYIHNGLAV